MVFPGTPKQGIIVFASGDFAFYYRHMQLTRDGVPYLRIFMIPWETTRYKYAHLIVPERTLRTEETVLGLFYFEYPAEYVIPISFDQENPVFWILCNFDGSLSNFNNIMRTKSDKIIQLQKESESYREDIERLNLTNRRLIQQLEDLGVRVGVK